LKKELARLPLWQPFREITEIGGKLADLHVNYESQPEYRLKEVENPNTQATFRVEKMRLSPDKTELIYNNFLILKGIPVEVYEYKLGNRSALEWIIERYQITQDKRSGIINDPNREDDEQYILRLIGQVITLSLETVKLVNRLKELGGLK
jgi:predicted helicase